MQSENIFAKKVEKIFAVFYFALLFSFPLFIFSQDTPESKPLSVDEIVATLRERKGGNCNDKSCAGQAGGGSRSWV